MWRWTLLLLFSILSIDLAANPDSLRVIWENNSLADTTRLNAAFDLTEYYINTEAYNPDSAKLYSELALELAEQTENLRYEAEARWNLGLISEPSNFEICASIFLEIGDTTRVSRSWRALGDAYLDLGKTWEAMDAYNMSLKVAESVSDSVLIAAVYNSMALAYWDIGEREKGYTLCKESYNIAKLTGDEDQHFFTAANLAYEYLYGDTTIYMAETYVLEAMQIDEKEQPVLLHIYADCFRLRADSALKAGNSSLANQEYKEAETQCRKALELGLSNFGEEHWMIGLCHTSLAAIFYKQNKLDVALQSLNEAYFIIGDTSQPRTAIYLYDLLYRVHSDLGNHKKAFENFQIFTNLRQAMRSEDNIKGVARAEMKYEYEKQQLADSLAQVEVDRLAAEEAEQIQAVKNRRNNLQYSGIIILVLALGMIIAYSGRINMSPTTAEGLIFIFFLLLFEFILVVMDPYVDNWSGGEVAVKLAINSLFALLVFFGHRFFEGRIKEVVIARNMQRQHMLSSDPEGDEEN